MRVAYVFPGQGSQFAGMGKALADAYPESRAAFEEADDALGFSLSRLCFEGPEEELKRTAVTQPAVLTVGAAAWAALRAAGAPDPAYLAGHSLGEYAAHVAAGTIPLAAAARLVRHRGMAMQEAVPEGEGAMVAVMGLPLEDLEAICGEVDGVVTAANDNAPGQVVLSGAAGPVRAAAEAARERGAKKAVELPVSAPFHCPLMEPARERLEPELREQPFADPKWPVVANVDARPLTAGDAARDALVRQVTATVRWTETLRFLHGEEVEALVEVGPGKVLTGLARRVSRDWKLLQVDDPAGLEKALGEVS
jgi:[acyl-carrier-protein] S-malonyltransferase